MTIEAQRPTGTPGTAPRGPAGPRPEPTGPKNPSPKPGTQKPPPSSPKGEALDTIADLLRVIALIAADKLPGADPAGRMRLAEGLRTCWSAVADLQTPARRDPEAVATHGGPVHISGRGGKVASPLASPRPVHPPAGRPPASGGDFLLPRDVRQPRGWLVEHVDLHLDADAPVEGCTFCPRPQRDVRAPVAAYGGEGGN